jgi:hypothetical protein
MIFPKYVLFVQNSIPFFAKIISLYKHYLVRINQDIRNMYIHTLEFVQVLLYKTMCSLSYGTLHCLVTMFKWPLCYDYLEHTTKLELWSRYLIFYCDQKPTIMLEYDVLIQRGLEFSEWIHVRVNLICNNFICCVTWLFWHILQHTKDLYGLTPLKEQWQCLL